MTYHPSIPEALTSLGSATWLVSRERRPSDAYEAWKRGTTATLRAGIHFDAVHLPATVVEDGIQGVKDRAAVELHFRAAGITGGVIVSRTQTRYSVLVPPNTEQGWAEPGTECLGRNHPAGYLAVPAPTREDPPGAYWLLPAPDGERMLCDPVKIRLLIGRSKARGSEG